MTIFVKELNIFIKTKKYRNILILANLKLGTAFPSYSDVILFFLHFFRFFDWPFSPFNFFGPPTVVFFCSFFSFFPFGVVSCFCVCFPFGVDSSFFVCFPLGVVSSFFVCFPFGVDSSLGVVVSVAVFAFFALLTSGIGAESTSSIKVCLNFDFFAFFFFTFSFASDSSSSWGSWLPMSGTLIKEYRFVKNHVFGRSLKLFDNGMGEWVVLIFQIFVIRQTILLFYCKPSNLLQTVCLLGNSF